MKFTKKMVMIPDEEYVALTKLLSGGDPIKTEKAKTDLKIKQTLRNPTLTTLEKGKKYDLLAKKRRKLIRMVEDKEKLIPTQTFNAYPLPTTGLVPAMIPQQQLQEAQQILLQPVPQEEQVPEEEVAEEEQTVTSRPTTRSHQESLNRYHGALAEGKDYHELRSRLEDYYEYFGITQDGTILSDRDREVPIQGSNYKNIVDYIAGRKAKLNIPDQKGLSVLIGRFADDDYTKKFIIPKQLGSGRKKYIIDLKKPKLLLPKTKGLVRDRFIFKPKLWVKLAV